MQKRVEQVQAMMKAKGLDALYIKSKENKRYLGVSTGSGVSLLLSLKQGIMIGDGRYTEENRQKARVNDLEELTCERGNNWATALKLAQAEGVKTLGLEEKVATIAEYKALKSAGFTDFLLTTELETLRAIKNPVEIELIKQACAITDEIMAELLAQLKVGMTEREVLGQIYSLALKKGAEGLAFDPIIASGMRGALPHGRATTKQLENNQLVTLDFGITYEGYQSDITRTVALGKNINPELLKIYGIVLEAQQQAIQAIKAGVIGSSIDQVARKVITEAGYGDFFVHGLGHGIGMGGGGEQPMLTPSSSTLLQNGMVMSCEPGIYIPNLGGVRIEDDILIEKGSGISLNKSSKELIFL